MTLTATFTEGKHAAEFLVSEADNFRSRKSITILSGQNLLSGHVMGKVSHVFGSAPPVAVSGSGNGAISDIKMGPLGKTGTYTATVGPGAAATNGGTFTVRDPDNQVLGVLVLPGGADQGATFRSDQIEFTITDGSTDFVAGDSFIIVVAESGIPAVIGTGNGVLSAISLGRQAEHGTYTLTCTATAANGGTFRVTTPTGQQLPDIVMTAGAGASTVYASDHVNLTITDGATDFAIGDVFYLPVLQAGDKYVEWDPTPELFDGRHRVAGVLYDAVDATSTDKSGVAVVLDAVVEKFGLNWITGVVAGEQAAAYEQLQQLGIVSR